jgi:hypothetical protein
MVLVVVLIGYAFERDKAHATLEKTAHKKVEVPAALTRAININKIAELEVTLQHVIADLNAVKARRWDIAHGMPARVNEDDECATQQAVYESWRDTLIEEQRRLEQDL